MSKHTPGPWVLDEYGNVYASKGRGRRKLLIAQTNRAHLEAGQPYANGRLVAGSPGLLEAVDGLLKMLEREGGPVSKEILFARAALAKAKP